MSRPFPSRNQPPASSFVRINGKIRAREVRVIGHDGSQLGVLPLTDALNLARQAGVDLVEIAPNAVPPVCRVVDFGKFRYEQAKKEKESKKHQHANKVKEVQLSPKIDPHDLMIKTHHAIGFLCDDMKVKVALKFRGREMAHTEYGFQVITKFVADVAPYGHPDFTPKLVGKSINLMISPLPRAKRAKNPHDTDNNAPGYEVTEDKDDDDDDEKPTKPVAVKPSASASAKPVAPKDGFANNPFDGIEVKPSLPSE
ncbi:MAG: translation initiation factor [Verrucomicrobiota bacterium]